MDQRILAAGLTTALLMLAGCSDEPAGPGDGAGDAVVGDALATLPGFAPLAATDVPLFSAPALVDTVRAGGEPVIAITHAGTILVSAHPGFTHYHPSEDATANVPDEIISPFAGQSYVWRSTDQGATWTHIGLPGMSQGPRSGGLGVSDPEFTVMDDGAICFTDLEALAAASTSCSLDDGVTWGVGNPISSGGSVDRQWLAAVDDEFYFIGAGVALRASTDYGQTWEDRGGNGCGQDIVGNPFTGHIVGGCDAGVTVSEDGGRTFEERMAPNGGLPETREDGTVEGRNRMAEPAIDSGGNVWVTYTMGEERLFVAGSPDEGKTWPWLYELTPHVRLAFEDGRLGGDFVCVEGGACSADPKAPGPHATNGTYVWPWVSAGSKGRLAVSWIGSFDETPSDEYGGNWYIFSAFLIDADTTSPQIVPVRITPDPIHEGPICQGGTGCQVQSMQGIDSGDRRLGDFFETTVGTDGYLYGSWSNTYQQPDDVISHPQFARQVGGIRLISDDELGKFTPTQG
jgi:hypothetical protein